MYFLLQIHYSSKEVTERRESLCVWLAGNRVPYTIKDDMSIEVSMFRGSAEEFVYT